MGNVWGQMQDDADGGDGPEFGDNHVPLPIADAVVEDGMQMDPPIDSETMETMEFMLDSVEFELGLLEQEPQPEKSLEPEGREFSNENSEAIEVEVMEIDDDNGVENEDKPEGKEDAEGSDRKILDDRTDSKAAILTEELQELGIFKAIEETIMYLLDKLDEGNDEKLEPEIVLLQPETQKASVKSEKILTIHELNTEIALKKEMLRKLKLVRLYKSKWNKEELKGHIQSWKEVAQNVLIELHQRMRNVHEGVNLENVLTNFGIEPTFIGYDAEEDCFI